MNYPSDDSSKSPMFTKQELEILEDAIDAYITNYASKSSSLVYTICTELWQKTKRLQMK